MVSSDSQIIIIGAGVFGLSTALWLARSGYKHVQVFDRCPVDKNNYDPSKGCDGASADINKIYRATYGTKRNYQALALEAKDIWIEWDRSIRSSASSELPAGMSSSDKLFDECGLLYVGEGTKMNSHYAQSLETAAKEAPETRKLQFIKGQVEDEDRLRKTQGSVWHHKLHMLDGVNNGNTHAILDVGAGITIADKERLFTTIFVDLMLMPLSQACTYARFLCEQAGVEFILGGSHGLVEKLLVVNYEQSKVATGVRTHDGLDHHADVVIVACGPWSASIIPEASQAVQATAGTVMFIDVPRERQDIWRKFHPDNFPAWSYRKGSGDTYYQGGGFPITEKGRLKFGFLGRKYTNFQTHANNEDVRVSTPRTKYTEEPVDSVPLFGLRRMKEIIGQAFPELKEFGFSDSRLCWYTDTSDDDDCVIDYVPGYSDSLFLCCGHGFKFLPNLGKYVKAQLERSPNQFSYDWRWRTIDGNPELDFPSNTPANLRSLSQYDMAQTQDFQFSESRL